MTRATHEFADWWRITPNPACPPWCESRHELTEFASAGAIDHCAMVIDTPRVTVERVLWQWQDGDEDLKTVEKLRVTTHRPDGAAVVNLLDATSLVDQLRLECLSLRDG